MDCNEKSIVLLHKNSDKIITTEYLEKANPTLEELIDMFCYLPVEKITEGTFYKFTDLEPLRNVEKEIENFSGSTSAELNEMIRCLYLGPGGGSFPIFGDMLRAQIRWYSLNNMVKCLSLDYLKKIRSECSLESVNGILDAAISKRIKKPCA